MSAKNSTGIILVLGATGNVGTALCHSLTKRKVHFRAGARNPAKAEPIRSPYCEIVDVDYAKPATLTAALKDVEKVFLVQGGGMDVIEEGKLVADAAAAAGVRHVVKLSAMGVAHPNRVTLMHEHRTVEEHMRAVGLQVTSLRPSAFYKNTLTFDSASIKKSNQFFSMVSSARMNWISVDDIGEAAAVCLTTPGHENSEYNLTGPDTVTMAELAAKYSKAFGREVHFIPIDEAAFRGAMAGFHMPAPQIDKIANLFAYCEAGGYDTHAPDLKLLTGSHGQPFDEFLAAHAAAFAP